MILASCRRNFDSTEFFGDLQLRNYPSLPKLTDYQAYQPVDLAHAMTAKHVLVLVHGFHNTIDDIAGAYSDMEKQLTARGLLAAGNYDVVIGFLWPGFKTDLGFFLAIPSANRSGAALRQLIDMMHPYAKTIDIETHSLGARVGLQALAFNELFVDNLILTAPAVDGEALERGEEFSNSLESCRRCLVYYSNNDPVLKVGYRLAEWARALGWDGTRHSAQLVNMPDVFEVDCSAVVDSHSGYRASPEFYADWLKALAEAPRPQVEILALDPGDEPV